jgi:hypothetical protein
MGRGENLIYGKGIILKKRETFQEKTPVKGVSEILSARFPGKTKALFFSLDGDSVNVLRESGEIEDISFSQPLSNPGFIESMAGEFVTSSEFGFVKVDDKDVVVYRRDGRQSVAAYNTSIDGINGAFLARDSLYLLRKDASLLLYGKKDDQLDDIKIRRARISHNAMLLDFYKQGEERSALITDKVETFSHDFVAEVISFTLLADQKIAFLDEDGELFTYDIADDTREHVVSFVDLQRGYPRELLASGDGFYFLNEDGLFVVVDENGRENALFQLDFPAHSMRFSPANPQEILCYDERDYALLEIEK